MICLMLGVSNPTFVFRRTNNAHTHDKLHKTHKFNNTTKTSFRLVVFDYTVKNKYVYIYIYIYKNIYIYIYI